MDAKRFNTGKLRYDLLEPFAMEQLVKVFTKGAEKYEDWNWTKGMPWNKMLASLKRHIAAFENGEDFDPELGTYHMANAAWNALGLVSYYKLCPEKDNRQHNYLQHKKISLDLDDVIVSWTGEWAKYFGIPLPKNWNFSYETDNNFKTFSKEKLEDFYLHLPPLIKPEELDFNVHCYITSRSLDENITRKWIENHQFPTKPVYSLGFGQSKVEAFKASGADYHIDDNYYNFIEMSKAGICCFLLTKPHNEKFDVGFKRIKDFADFKNRFL